MIIMTEYKLADRHSTVAVIKNMNNLRKKQGRKRDWEWQRLLRAHYQEHSSSKAKPPYPYQRVLSPGDQVLK